MTKMPHTYFPPSRWFCSQPAEKACLLHKPLLSPPSPLPSAAPSARRPPLSPGTPSPHRPSPRLEWAGLDQVLIIEIFGPLSEAKTGRCFPQVLGTDSSWALPWQGRVQEMSWTLKPGSQQEAFCWAPGNAHGPGVRWGQKLKACGPPHPCLGHCPFLPSPCTTWCPSSLAESFRREEAI